MSPRSGLAADVAEHNEINDQDDSIVALLFLAPPSTGLLRVKDHCGEVGYVRLGANRD